MERTEYTVEVPVAGGMATFTQPYRADGLANLSVTVAVNKTIRVTASGTVKPHNGNLMCWPLYVRRVGGGNVTPRMAGIARVAADAAIEALTTEQVAALEAAGRDADRAQLARYIASVRAALDEIEGADPRTLYRDHYQAVTTAHYDGRNIQDMAYSFR